MNPTDPQDELEHESGPDEQEPDPVKEPAARMVYRQITVSEQEKQRLYDRIYHDFLGARSDHDSRIARFRRYYRMWRGLNQTRGTREEGNDFQVPIVKWSVSGAWAKYMQGLLGDDAEIIGKNAAPSSQADAKKAGLYMTWRVFEYMKIVAALAAWTFRSTLFGRAFAEVSYEQEYYWERGDAKAMKAATTDANGKKRTDIRVIEVGDGIYDYETLAYDGPRMLPLWPSQLITPAQDDVTDPDGFEWIIRRTRATPQELLEGEAKGKFQGILENWDKITAAASQRQERDYWWDDERIDADEAEGVDHVNMLGNRDSVEVWRWYGKWRMPKGKRDTRPDNIKYRDTIPSELMVTVLPRVNLVVGIADRRDLYPRLRKRTPFVDLSLMKEGSYWPPGFGELLEDIQNESTINHALFRKAGMLSVGPIIFYKPSSGFDPGTFEYSAGTAVPCENPADVKVITLTANLSYVEMMQQALKAIAELVTGVNDQSLGRSSDQPNAPRTASGQAMLLNEGNIRASLDMTMLREDMEKAIQYIWSLDSEYADEKVFFRVTDEDAVGFDTTQGFGTMTAEERNHPFQFTLKFATSVYSREAKKQHMLQLYSLSIANPIIQQNPRALWVLLNRIWEAFGEDDFSTIVPEPPEPEQPKRPKDEWILMLKGEIVHVSPLDNDDEHILEHRKRLEQEINEPPERQDKEAIRLSANHIIEHEHQKVQKMALQMIAQRAVALIQSQQGTEGAPAAPQGEGAPAPLPQPAQPPQIPPAPMTGAAGPVGPQSVGGMPQ